MNRTITQLVNLLRTFADELEGHCVAAVAAEATTEQSTAPKKRGPKPKTEEPAQPAEPTEPATEGMKLEELQALIQPAVKAAAGKQVKDLIAKHGGTQLSNLPVANHAAFAEDVGALVY